MCVRACARVPVFYRQCCVTLLAGYTAAAAAAAAATDAAAHLQLFNNSYNSSKTQAPPASISWTTSRTTRRHVQYVVVSFLIRHGLVAGRLVVHQIEVVE